MNVWLVKLDEPLVQSVDSRFYRMSMIASALAKSGHSVTWWVSDFDHLKNKYNCSEKIYNIHENIKYLFVKSLFSYKKSVSFKRLLNNIFTSFRIFSMLRNRSKPDLIICSMPTPFNCKIFTKYALLNDIPVIIDCRDMWPNVIMSELSFIKKILFIPFYFKMNSDLKYVSEHAFSFIGITDYFVNFIPSLTNRELSRHDKSFPLGYKKVEVLNSFKSSLINDLNLLFRFDIRQKKIVYFAGRINKTFYTEFKKIFNVLTNFSACGFNYVFVFCGTGGFLDKIYREFNIPSCKNVLFPGEVDSKSLSVLREYSYLSLQPICDRIDYNNSLSNKFFENLSSGLPIITSLSGITKHTLVEYECGISYTEPSELNAILLKLYDDTYYRDKLSRNATQLFIKKYSYDVVYTDLIEHIIKVVDEYNV